MGVKREGGRRGYYSYIFQIPQLLDFLPWVLVEDAGANGGAEGRQVVLWQPMDEKRVGV